MSQKNCFEQAVGGDANCGQKTRILYLEDEPFLGKIVKESLESRDFEVVLVADGRDALAAFEKEKPEICLLDVMLPGIDGFEIGRQIRQKDAAVPILFLTAKSETADVVAGFGAGGNDYVRKPFSLEELIVRLKNLLVLSQKATFSIENEVKIWPVGRFQFFPERQELVFENTVKRLSHRETQLLEMLASAASRPVRRVDILKKIWGHDSIFNSRNLDVYAARLREQLRDDPEVQILTLKGVGYRLVF